MFISLNWLRDFVDLPKNLDPQELADRLTMHVVEVEGFEREEDVFANMCVGKVIEIRAHPNADRLKVCRVDIGKPSISKQSPNSKFHIPNTPIEIVCGGKNLYEGMLVSVALPGAKVRWHGEGDLVELKETEIRGVSSYGMICAGDEIGLGDLQKEQPIQGEGPQILDLSATRAKPGVALAKALGKDDTVFEISNVSLSNRPDLWSHFGIAVEVARLYQKGLKTGKMKLDFATGRKGSQKDLKVNIQAKDCCARYSGALVEDVRLGATPAWMRRRLEAVGQRSISTLVDISNYVMFEMGQPVHIFDKSRIKDQESGKIEIIIRRARKGEKLKTLDGVERVLDTDTLVIADYEKPIAIAGIIGGLDSGVTDATSSIIIECATFDPVSIRKTSARLGLKTDAAQRFEKALDTEQAGYAMARVLALVKECGDASAAPKIRGVVDAHGPLKNPQAIRVPYELIEKRVGAPIPQMEAKKILQALGFIVHPVRSPFRIRNGSHRGRLTSNGVKGTKKIWRVTPPTKRATRDIAIPEDIVEEIARHLGYSDIPDALPLSSIAPPSQVAVRLLERSLKTAFIGKGFDEVMHKPFINPTQWERFGFEKGPHVSVVNPIDPAASILRRSILPGLCADIMANRDRHDELRLFEWGRVYMPEHEGESIKKGSKVHLPHQPTHCSGVWYGVEKEEQALRMVSGILLTVLSGAGYRASVQPMKDEKELAYLREGGVLRISVGGQFVGVVGLANEGLRRECAASARHTVVCFTIGIDALARAREERIAYRAIPQYPPVPRDIAIMVDEGVAYREIEAVIRGEGGGLLKEVELFDMFRGGQVPEGKKSMAFHLVFQDTMKTLESGEIDRLMQKIKEGLCDRVRASIRGED